MSLDFLSKIIINEEEIPSRKPGGGGRRKDWNPSTPLTIRVWKSGKVFPSQDLVDRFELEYGDRPVAEAGSEPAVDDKPAKWIQPGNALDVFDSKDFPAFKTPQRFILANVVTKAAGKADLFAAVTWNAEGIPENSVMDQGAATFGKAELLSMLKEVYNIELDDGNPYIDLQLLGKDGAKGMQHFPIEKGFCFIPKKFSRGGDKGKDTVVRRENPWIFVLYPIEKETEEAPKD